MVYHISYILYKISYIINSKMACHRHTTLKQHQYVPLSLGVIQLFHSLKLKMGMVENSVVFISCITT